jgi:hypothetical protein
MIKKIIRLKNDMVLVFDEEGEQLPEYQGCYMVVKEKIIEDAPAGAIFNHWFGYSLKPDFVETKSW